MEEKLQFSSPSTVPMQRKCESILFFSLVVYLFFFSGNYLYYYLMLFIAMYLQCGRAFVYLNFAVYSFQSTRKDSGIIFKVKRQV